jgi:transcriptional regulator with XRE-family HTH domain
MMSADSLTAWRERLHLNARAAAAALGCSRTTLAAYERGKVRIPRYIALACAAIAQGVPPIS